MTREQITMGGAKSAEPSNGKTGGRRAILQRERNHKAGNDKEEVNPQISVLEKTY